MAALGTMAFRLNEREIQRAIAGVAQRLRTRIARLSRKAGALLKRANRGLEDACLALDALQELVHGDQSTLHLALGLKGEAGQIAQAVRKGEPTLRLERLPARTRLAGGSGRAALRHGAVLGRAPKATQTSRAGRRGAR